MNIKCAIFDFDGTLFDSMFIWDEIGERYLRSLGKEPKPSMREAVRTLSLYQAACYLRREYNLPLSTEGIMKGINQMVEHFYLSEILPKPGVCEFLEHMKKAGISMCIATASERYQIEAALKRCGMSQYFGCDFHLQRKSGMARRNHLFFGKQWMVVELNEIQRLYLKMRFMQL